MCEPAAPVFRASPGEKVSGCQPCMVLGQPGRKHELFPLCCLQSYSAGVGVSGSLAGLAAVMLDWLLSGLASMLTQSRAHEFNWPLPG